MVPSMMIGRFFSLAALAIPLAMVSLPGAAADIGLASFYGKGHNGKVSASGKRFDQEAMTAAHRTLPFGSRILVTNLGNGRSVIVEVSDRGPFRRSRIVDVSYAAARQLDFVRQGVARVKLDPL
jgi:rare lipoprotein A